MAIQKAKTLANGSSGNYWRLTNINIDRQGLKIVAAIALFKDAATAASGAPPLGLTKTFSFSFTMGEVAAQTNLITWVYTKIIAMANATVTKDILGHTVSPMPYDSDIAGGDNV